MPHQKVSKRDNVHEERKQQNKNVSWLLLIICILPMFSEAIHSPLLPELAKYFRISSAEAEYTISSYLLGFSFGVLCWGRIADLYGRKKTLLLGLSIYTLATLFCYAAFSVKFYIVSRIGQAIGVSACSVLSQTICRDVFRGKALNRIYGNMSISFALFSALGPLFAMAILGYFGQWRDIFVFLCLMAFLIIWLIIRYLPETKKPTVASKISIFMVIKKLLQDKNVIGFTILIAACKGISFSYFAEGPFILRETLGMSAQNYSFTFTYVYIGSILAGLLSNKLHNYYGARQVLNFGIFTICIGSLLFYIFIQLATKVFIIANDYIIIGIIIFITIIKSGITIVVSNSLAAALLKHQDYLGTASSLFGSAYYMCTSLVTYGMIGLRDGTVIAMPFYFCLIIGIATLCRIWLIEISDKE